MGNAVNVQSDPKENLKDDHVRAALRKDKGSASTLISWGLEDLTMKANNYIGMVTRLHVSYGHCNKQYEETYVVKLAMPQPSKALRDMVTQGYRKELFFYQELLPALNQELKAVGLNPLLTPECFHTNGDLENLILILTDLRSRSFKSVSGNTCLDVPHVHLALQELAKLHASSCLLQAKIKADGFDAQYSFLDKEWYNVTEDAIAFFKTLFDRNVENAVTILKTLEGDERVIQWLLKIKPDVYSILEGQMQRDSVFTTVCHADCVSNNFMFRYNDGGDPVEALLLDFQIVRRASLVTDLHLLLDISVYGADRKEHLEDFLQTYYTSFKEILDAGGEDMPFTLQDLQREYDDKFVFGLLWAMAVLPMVTRGGKIDDWTGSEKSPDPEAAKEKEKAVNSKISGKHAELRRRFLPLFEELLEKNIIS